MKYTSPHNSPIYGLMQWYLSAEMQTAIRLHQHEQAMNDSAQWDNELQLLCADALAAHGGNRESLSRSLVMARNLPLQAIA